MHLVHAVKIFGYSLAELASNLDVSGAGAVTNRKGEPIRGKFGDWDYVACGNPSGGVLGRIPFGIEVIAEVDPEVVIWGTGASWLRIDGRSEAQVFHDVAVDYLRALDRNREAERLLAISVIDDMSDNSALEIHETRKILSERFSVRTTIALHLVSSPNHLPRLIQNGLMNPAGYNVWMIPRPAHTCYGGKTLNDTYVGDLGQY